MLFVFQKICYDGDKNFLSGNRRSGQLDIQMKFFVKKKSNSMWNEFFESGILRRLISSSECFRLNGRRDISQRYHWPIYGEDTEGTRYSSTYQRLAHITKSDDISFKIRHSWDCHCLPMFSQHYLSISKGIGRVAKIGSPCLMEYSRVTQETLVR